MSKKNQHSAQHTNVLKKQALEQSEVKEVLTVIKKYAVPVGAVILVICGFFLFDSYLKTSKASKESKADAAMMNAMTADDFQNIIDKYGSTSVAPIAMMNLAMAKFSGGDYSAAQDLYGKFLKKYAKHEMAPQAELNLITCREAKGELSEAQILYSDFASKHEGSYLAPVALIGHARCLEALGADVDAKQAYEDLVVAYPGSSWAGLAETRMTVLNSKLK